jgi:hypothetical protein
MLKYVPWNYVITFILISFFTIYTKFHTYNSNIIKNKCSKSISPNQLIGIYGNVGGQYTRVIDTRDPSAIKLFNQGIIQLFGFNRIEAEKNFEAALNFDKNCLFCFLGILLSNGPTINNHVDYNHFMKIQKTIKSVSNLITLKLQKSHSGTDESVNIAIALIEAQKSRYPSTVQGWLAIRETPMHLEYSVAMEQVYSKFMDDDDVASLYADSLILLNPWDYFNPKYDQYGNLTSFKSRNHISNLKPGITKAYQVLREVLNRNSKHILALHLYIHILEQTSQPEDGEFAADSLAEIVEDKGTGHLVHMPSHVYIRSGRYQDAIISNMKAVQVDNYFAENCMISYVTEHNSALLIMAALLNRNITIALQYATPTAVTSHQLLSEYLTAMYQTPRELVFARFGRWDDILKLHYVQTHDILPLTKKNEVNESDELRRRKFLSARNLRSYTYISRQLDTMRTSFDSLPAFHKAVYYYSEALASIHTLNHREYESNNRIINNLFTLSTAIADIPKDSLPIEHIFYPYHRELGVIMNSTAYASYLYQHSFVRYEEKRFRYDHYFEVMRLLKHVMDIQDSFKYMEPEIFYLPICHCLGAVFIEVSRSHYKHAEVLQSDIISYSMNNPTNIHETKNSMIEHISQSLDFLKRASEIFSNDLEDHPRNEWSINGLINIYILAYKLQELVHSQPKGFELKENGLILNFEPRFRELFDELGKDSRGKKGWKVDNHVILTSETNLPMCCEVIGCKS